MLYGRNYRRSYHVIDKVQVNMSSRAELILWQQANNMGQVSNKLASDENNNNKISNVFFSMYFVWDGDDFDDLRLCGTISYFSLCSTLSALPEKH